MTKEWTREMVVEKMRERLTGQFTTVREELVDMVKDATAMFAFSVEDFGEYITVGYEDQDDEYIEIIVPYEQAGRTWYITDVE